MGQQPLESWRSFTVLVKGTEIQQDRVIGDPVPRAGDGQDATQAKGWDMCPGAQQR
jgi:hypothetical protein